jgi:hypothetical protein
MACPRVSFSQRKAEPPWRRPEQQNPGQLDDIPVGRIERWRPPCPLGNSRVDTGLKPRR